MRIHSLVSAAFVTVTAVILTVTPTTSGSPMTADVVSQKYPLLDVMAYEGRGSHQLMRRHHYRRYDDDEQDGDRSYGRGDGDRYYNNDGDDEDGGNRHRSGDEQDGDRPPPSRPSGGRSPNLLTAADETTGSLPLAAEAAGRHGGPLDSAFVTTLDGDLVPGSQSAGRRHKGDREEA